MHHNGSLDSNWVSDIETNWSLYQDAQKQSFKFEHFESSHKSLVWHCHTVTRVFNQTTKHWVQFLPLDLYCCQNWQELLQKHHFHLHINQFINATEVTINLANKRNSPGSRADDIRWVRPWRICGAWRTSGVHQVKSATSRLQQISNPHSRQICYASVNKSTTAAVGKFNEQIFLERFPQNMNQSFKICLSLAVCIP